MQSTMDSLVLTGVDCFLKVCHSIPAVHGCVSERAGWKTGHVGK
jgi:hypothetical protein